MSIADKNREILAKGEAERAQFDPEPDSAPVRMYHYWIKNAWVHGEDAPARENFCHYWRIVVIWAPFWWLFLHTLYPIFTSRPAHAAARGLGKIHVPARLKQFQAKYGERIALGFMYTLAAVAVGCLLVVLVIAFLTNPIDFLKVFGLVVGTMIVLSGLALGVSYLVDRHTLKKSEALHKEFEAYYRGELDEPPLRHKPGRFKKFFKAVGEYFRVGFNVIRTKKWKICPYVTVPGVDTEESF